MFSRIWPLLRYLSLSLTRLLLVLLLLFVLAVTLFVSQVQGGGGTVGAMEGAATTATAPSQAPPSPKRPPSNGPPAPHSPMAGHGPPMQGAPPPPGSPYGPPRGYMGPHGPHPHAGLPNMSGGPPGARPPYHMAGPHPGHLAQMGSPLRGDVGGPPLASMARGATAQGTPPGSQYPHGPHVQPSPGNQAGTTPQSSSAASQPAPPSPHQSPHPTRPQTPQVSENPIYVPTNIVYDRSPCFRLAHTHKCMTRCTKSLLVSRALLKSCFFKRC